MKILLLVFALLWRPTVYAEPTPHPVCGTRTRPLYPVANAPPVVQVWKPQSPATGVTPLTPDCTGLRSRDFALLVELVGSVHSSGSADDLLARFGAISAWRGLRYWSVTDARWHPWITEATALESLHSGQRRADFTVEEMQSGKDLYFAQHDNRFSNNVVYRLRVHDSDAARLAISLENVSSVRLFVLTAFAAGDLQSAFFLERLSPTIWGYYSLSGIRKSPLAAVEAHEKSYVNRIIAMYRHLMHVPTDQDPPLMR